MLLFVDRFVVLSLSTVIKSCQQMEINEGFSCHSPSTPANACPAPDRGPCSPSPSIPQYLGLSEEKLHQGSFGCRPLPLTTSEPGAPLLLTFPVTPARGRRMTTCCTPFPAGPAAVGKLLNL